MANRMPFANTSPSIKFTKVADAGYCKFANIFPHQKSETIDSLRSYPTKILRYMVVGNFQGQ